MERQKHLLEMKAGALHKAMKSQRTKNKMKDLDKRKRKLQEKARGK